jgi:hypothetical protein
MLINRGRGLGAAIAVFSVELQCAYPVVTMNALEDAAVLDACICVMSHNAIVALFFEGPVERW